MLLPASFPPLYPILDSAALQRAAIPLLAAADTLLSAGVTLLQFRHKTHFSRALLRDIRELADICAAAGATFVLNDRADLALLAQSGLHLGQDDLPPAAARRLLGPSALIGFSTHNAAQLQLAAAQPVDYLAIGPVFPTHSKDNPDPVVGLAALPALRRLTTCPLVAIGGITLENAPSVYAAGIDSVALISALVPPDGSLYEMRARAQQWLAVASRGKENRKPARSMV